jgi:hypothetical protein
VLLGACAPGAGAGAPPAPRCLLLLGPNMGGKSTYLRAAAHAVILAQLGSFVPAGAGARCGVADAVYARVGASDDVGGHRSTFWVEMEETADILRGATRRSLVIIDEVGRGTAVADGLAIGLAVLEHLAAAGVRTLFATHFPEMAVAALPGGAAPPISAAIFAAALPGHGAAAAAAQRATHAVVPHPIHAAITAALAQGARAQQLASHPGVRQALAGSWSQGLAVARDADIPAGVLQRAGTVLANLQDAGAPQAWAEAVRKAASA